MAVLRTMSRLWKVPAAADRARRIRRCRRERDFFGQDAADLVHGAAKIPAFEARCHGDDLPRSSRRSSSRRVLRAGRPLAEENRCASWERWKFLNIGQLVESLSIGEDTDGDDSIAFENGRCGLAESAVLTAVATSLASMPKRWACSARRAGPRMVPATMIPLFESTTPLKF